jgi:hypothetical protein
MVEKKATARPGQGFGRNPSAGVTKRGLGLTVHFRARNSFQQRQLKKRLCLLSFCCRNPEDEEAGT